MDIANQSEFLLTVAGTIVNLSSNSRFNVENYHVDYEGKQLVFTEITSGVPTQGVFTLNASVTLQMNFGSGMQTYFRGKILKRGKTGQNNLEGVQYTCVGIQQLADEVFINYNGYPEWGIVPDVYVSTDGTGVSTFFGRSVSSAITEIFSLMASELGSYGIPATIGTPGTDVFSSYVTNDFNFSNTTFVQAIKQLAAQEPAIRVFFDDLQNKWIFVNLRTASNLQIIPDPSNLLSLDVEEDLASRYTAVHLWSVNEYVLASGPKLDVSLIPDWNSGLEADWDLQKATGSASATTVNTDYAFVYRRWRLPASMVGFDEKSPYVLFAQVPYWSNEQRYISLSADIDVSNGVVLSRSPILTSGNPYVAGSARGPLDVVLSYYNTGTAPFIDYPQLRLPSSGYEGTAHTQYGVERVMRKLVDLFSLIDGTAQAMLDLHKDVIINGTLPLDGDPIESLINLQRRISIAGTPYPTGMETIGALYTGYTYNFGKRGQNQVNLSTDFSSVIRVR